MKSPAHPRPLRRRGAARVIPEDAAAAPVDDQSSYVQHPDGWYWVAPDGRQQFGPFETLGEARADRERDSEQAPTEGETLQEAADEIGMSDWIDPETGEPAEGRSPPHLDAP